MSEDALPDLSQVGIARRKLHFVFAIDNIRIDEGYRIACRS